MENDKGALLLFTAGVGVAGLIAFRLLRRLFRCFRKLINPLAHRKIVIIESVTECQNVVEILKEHTSKYNVLGFDVEWVQFCGQRRPCALLQLSSHTGLCALFRLSHMRTIPNCLVDLLKDEMIVKVGVGPQDDAKKLMHDYHVSVASTFDLRFLAYMTGHKAEGLAKLSRSILNVELDKHWQIAASNWEAPELTHAQQLYAANDALAAIEIFRKLFQELKPRGYWSYLRGKLYVEDFYILKRNFDTQFPPSLCPRF